MSRLQKIMQSVRTRTVAFISIIIAVSVTAVSCSSGSGPAAVSGIPPELVADYVHTVMAADRTAYTKHIVSRSKKLEGKEKADGVLAIEATEGWQQTDGIPLPAQMFRLGSEIASDGSDFTYNLISTWNINDSQAPKNDFEKKAMDAILESGEPYKAEQELGGQKYFSALYPDKAVAEACVTCHNTHPIHKERYPDKVFKLDDVMGGIMINIPLGDA